MVYEQPTISYYKENSNKFSVVNINVTNIGNTYVESISFSVSLKGHNKNLKCSYDQSSLLIKVLNEVDTIKNNIYTIAFLNRAENIRFNTIVSGYINTNQLIIELRGKGYIGHKLLDKKVDALKRFYASFLSFVIIIMIVLMYGIFVKFQQPKRLNGKVKNWEDENIKEV